MTYVPQQNAQYVTKTANYTVVAADTGKVIGVDSSGGAVTITLPAISAAGSRFEITIKDATASAGTNNITVARTGTDTIDGAAASFVIDNPDASYTFRANATNTDWEIV